MAVKEVRSARIYTILLVSVILVSISSVFSMILTSVLIRSTGEVRYPSDHVTAESGSASDIQDAIDLAVLLGADTVYIPEGTYEFNEYPSWQTVYVPAGISIFGAPTERTSGLPYDGTGMNPNDQVIEWKTVLQMTWEAPDHSTWFEFNEASPPSLSTEPQRFSDIKLVGYRNFDPTSTTMYPGVDINDVMDFRVDHCFFLDLAKEAVNPDSNIANGACRGVIDHCKIVNTVGDPDPYETRTVDYGIAVTGGYGTTRWEPIDQVLGHYTDYTVFVEDCYFEKWRHVIASSNGPHYVFRYNTIQYDYGYHSIDSHGNYDISTRAVEVYGNEIIDCIGDTKGGAQFNCDGVAFNNYVDDSHTHFIWLWRRAGSDFDAGFWVWDNYLDAGVTEVSDSAGVAIYRKPNLAQDGFEYTAYTYPHPLTLGST